MIDKADLDNDGLVSEEEFYQIMIKKNKWFAINHENNFIL